MGDEDFISPRQAAEMVGVTVQNIYDWLAAGKLAGFKRRVNGRVYVKRSDVQHAAAMIPLPRRSAE